MHVDANNYRSFGMTERQTLECILQVAAMEYKNTQDEWWFDLGVAVGRKIGRRQNVLKKKETKV